MGKKYRKIAKAVIHLKKKYFIGSSTSINKWIHLELFTTSFEAMGHETLILSAMNNMGKIYMNAELKQNKQDDKSKIQLDENTDLNQAYNKAIKDDIKMLEVVKDKATQNKTEKFKSVVEGNNEFLRNIKNMKNHSGNDLFEDILDDGKCFIFLYFYHSESNLFLLLTYIIFIHRQIKRRRRWLIRYFNKYY